MFPAISRLLKAPKRSQRIVHPAIDVDLARPNTPRHTFRPFNVARPDASAETVNAVVLGADVNAMDDNGETPMHGAAYGSFPTVIELLANNKAAADIWKHQNTHGWTPLFIAEGHRPGNFKPAPATIEALERLMRTEGISTDGSRPRKINEAYEKKKASPKTPPRPKP